MLSAAASSLLSPPLPLHRPDHRHLRSPPPRLSSLRRRHPTKTSTTTTLLLPPSRATMMPVDPWAPGMVDSQGVASQLFALSLFPYLGFLFFLTRSRTAPRLTLFGFYFLLAFVAATIPAGIYAKVQYGTSLSNVDWLHGGAESLLTLTNLFIVLGLMGALRKIKEEEEAGN